MDLMPMRFWIVAALGFGAAALGSVSAHAQGFPGGSYQRSCQQIHWSGTTLVAECRKEDGGFSGTGLANANTCRGDIANLNGQLRCVMGGAPAQGYASPPGGGYGAPGGGYGAPGGGYGAPGGGYGGGYGSGYAPPAPGYSGGWEEHRAHCDELWHREHELRERIDYAPWGPDRERLEYRAREVHEERERFGCAR